MTKIIKKLTRLQCRCGHIWVPRKKVVVVCPKCHSPYWDVPLAIGGNGRKKPHAKGK